MSIKIIATPVRRDELVDGDLHTYHEHQGQAFWDNLRRTLTHAVSFQVFMHCAPSHVVDEPDCRIVHRLEIVDDEPEPADLTDDQARRLFEAAVALVKAYDDEAPEYDEWIEAACKRQNKLRDVVHEILGVMEPKGGDA